MQKIKSLSLSRCIALAMACSMAAPAVAGTREGYDLWQQGDFFGAVREWRPSAVEGDPIAQFNLARAYQLGRGVPVDMKMAESWFGKAAAQGHVPSRDNYGLTLFQNGDRETAMPYIEDAAGRGDPRAQYVLGTALFNGDTVKKDWPRAYAMMTRASAAGISAASASLAQMDKFIPADQRQQGLVLARALETLAVKPAVGDGMVAEPGTTHSRIATEELPPSRIGAPPLPAKAPAKPATKPAVKTAAKPAPQPVKPAPAPKPAKPAPAPKPAVAAHVQPAPAKPQPKPATPPVAKAQPKPAPKPAPKPVAPPPQAAQSAKPVPAAKPAQPAKTGSWRVQLGAFGDAAKAHAMWDAVHKKVGALGPYKPSFVAAGKVTRLQTGSFPTRDGAEKLCAAVKAAGACIPVAP